jgi:hypothetical protein
MDLTAPAVETSVDARFGDGIRLVGYDLLASPNPQSQMPSLQLTLYWQALAPMGTRYKVFVHLLGQGGPSDVRAQADVWPRLATSAWVPGEYLSDHLELDLTADLPNGSYTVLMGLYDEATFLRLPLLDPAGQVMGDSLVLDQVRLGE